MTHAIVICRECEELFHVEIVRGGRPQRCARCREPLLALREDWCDDCGCVHDAADRQSRLARLMPAAPSEVVNALGHLYDGRARMLARDLAALRRRAAS